MTIALGLFLLMLGVAAYGWSLTTDTPSFTALIPAFVGTPILILGVWGRRVAARKALATHIAIVLAVIGLLGAGRGLISLPALITNPDDVARPVAVVVQSIMALACLVYLVFAVRSFLAARRGGAG